MLDKWSSYAGMTVWELYWTDSTLVVLEKWSFCKGGHLSMFDYISKLTTKLYISKDFPKILT